LNLNEKSERDTHVVGHRRVVPLSASQRLGRLLQNLVVLFGKQSKQTAGDTEREREGGKGVRAVTTDE